MSQATSLCWFQVLQAQLLCALSSIVAVAGMRDPSHVLDNTKMLQFSLDAEDLAMIDQLLQAAEPPFGDPYSFERQ